MNDEPDPERLKALEARIKAIKGPEVVETASDSGTDLTEANLAWQMVIELVSGIAIGFGIGWGLDALFGTRPIMLVIFTLLGFAAGVRVMLGTARQMQDNAAPAATEDETGASAPNEQEDR